MQGAIDATFLRVMNDAEDPKFRGIGSLINFDRKTIARMLRQHFSHEIP
jgi:hypothetical protein